MQEFSKNLIGVAAVFALFASSLGAVALVAVTAQTQIANVVAFESAQQSAAAAQARTSLAPDEVQAVTALLQSYNTDSGTIAKVQAVLGNPHRGQDAGHAPMGTSTPREDMHVPARAAVCAFFTRSLQRGDSGDDVAQLQDFLQGTGDLTASSTGFFGEKTELALRLWQARAGVVASGTPQTTGFGLFGPRTRTLLMQQCKGVPAQKPATSTPESF